MAWSSHLSHFLQLRSLFYVCDCFNLNVPISLGKVEWTDHYCSSGNEQVSINKLIGLDNYWRFMKYGIVQIAQSQFLDGYCRGLASYVQ